MKGKGRKGNGREGKERKGKGTEENGRERKRILVLFFNCYFLSFKSRMATLIFLIVCFTVLKTLGCQHLKPTWLTSKNWSQSSSTFPNFFWTKTDLTWVEIINIIDTKLESFSFFFISTLIDNPSSHFSPIYFIQVKNRAVSSWVMSFCRRGQKEMHASSSDFIGKRSSVITWAADFTNGLI